MKKADPGLEYDDLRPEYRIEDFGAAKGVRGMFYRRIQARSNVVRIAPDLSPSFPNEQAVNDALRALLRVATTAVKPTARRRNARRGSKPARSSG